MDKALLVAQIAKELEGIKGWVVSDCLIKKTFCFNSHIDVIKFVEAVSLEAISSDVYPELKITFEKVDIIFEVEDDLSIYSQIDFIKKIEMFCDCYNPK